MKYLLSLLLILPLQIELGLNKNPELETVRKQIKTVESDIESNKNKTRILQQELRDNEIAEGRIAIKIRDIEQQQSEVTKSLEYLIDNKLRVEESIQQERKQLAMQIRAAYMTGRDDRMKLVLNQEDPSRIERILTYFEYHNRSRVKQINSLLHKLNHLESIGHQIDKKNNELETLKTSHFMESKEIKASRLSRQSIISELEKHIESQGLILQTLREQETALSGLLDDLDKNEQLPPEFKNITPFDSLRGKLNWPVAGTPANIFGSKKNQAGHRWQGIKINTEAGSEVRAISSGKVIFADWFKNLGLLIILDHGDGFMSLYGHNQGLLKKSGDWVLDNEIIAYSGDTGGENTPGVYLEIRHNGKPLNPVLWCRK